MLWFWTNVWFIWAYLLLCVVLTVEEETVTLTAASCLLKLKKSVEGRLDALNMSTLSDRACQRQLFPQPNMIIIYCCIWVRWGNMYSIWFLLNNVISCLHKYKSNQRNQHWSQYQTLAYNTQQHTHARAHTHTHEYQIQKVFFTVMCWYFYLYLNIYYYISVAGCHMFSDGSIYQKCVDIFIISCDWGMLSQNLNITCSILFLICCIWLLKDNSAFILLIFIKEICPPHANSGDHISLIYSTRRY